jgi:adenylate kinase
MKIILLGPPGVGKGTQARLISSKYGIPHISTGDIFRKAIADETKLGLEAKEYMNKGQLVPDQLVISIVMERLKEKDCEKGFLLDGFPRTIKQAEALSKAIDIDKVINITAPGELIIKTLVGRRFCKDCSSTYHIQDVPPKEEGICDICHGHLYQREDDRVDVIKSRLEVYEEETKPLIEYYKEKGILATVIGLTGIDKVFAEITKVLGSEA